MFQSTHPRRVWPMIDTSNFRSQFVSIHTPTKGVTRCTAKIATPTSFNPHTHEGCDYTFCWCVCFFAVSIHTPTKGVTPSGKSWLDAYRVSIHTPTKGVTLLLLYRNIRRYSFNPHTHEGCDCALLLCLFYLNCFNPHTHEGCDIYLRISSYHNIGFNPHTHEGCDVS